MSNASTAPDPLRAHHDLGEPEDATEDTAERPRASGGLPDRGHPDGGHPDRRHPDRRHPDGGHPDRRHPDGGHPDPRQTEPEHFDADDFFGLQRTTSDRLPDPLPLLENLSRCVIEVLAGARELDQLARWVTDDVYRHLLKRVVLAARARAVKSSPVRRPQLSIGHTVVCRPREDVVEAVVIVHTRARTRAVAIRLEGLDSRWRASAVSVL